MTVKWLGTLKVRGVEFRKGDNGSQLFYDYVQADGTYWCILQTKAANPPYWSAMVETRERGWRTLNTRHIGLDGKVVEQGKLWGKTDLGHIDPPLKLLRSMAWWIKSGRLPCEP